MDLELTKTDYDLTMVWGKDGSVFDISLVKTVSYGLALEAKGDFQ